MRIFYVNIDENKTCKFLKNWNLNQSDSIVFIGRKSSTSVQISEVADILELCNIGVKISLETVDGDINTYLFSHLYIQSLGKNSLKHYIVSNKKGVSTLVDYICKKTGINNIFLINSCFDELAWSIKNRSSSQDDFNKKLIEEVPDGLGNFAVNAYSWLFDSIDTLSEEDREIVNKIIAKSKDYNQFRNSLRSTFGEVRGSGLYWETKEEFRKYKESSK